MQLFKTKFSLAIIIDFTVFYMYDTKDVKISHIFACILRVLQVKIEKLLYNSLTFNLFLYRQPFKSCSLLISGCVPECFYLHIVTFSRIIGSFNNQRHAVKRNILRIFTFTHTRACNHIYKHACLGIYD